MTEPTTPTRNGKPPIAVGDMSPEGSTTVVHVNRPQLDFADQKVLCSAMCKCEAQPNIGADGRSLKQECVSGRLKALDTALGHTSPYKAEYTYDMTKRPPEPFLDKVIETRGRDLWPGWTKTLWPKDPTRPQPYKAGRGYTRRPDVVIVKDPTRPPTQDNIKQVVEMKFPGDTYGSGQLEDYGIIAGDEKKLVSMELQDCDCNKAEPEKSKTPVEQLGPAAAILGIIYMAVTKRPPPGGVPAY